MAKFTQDANRRLISFCGKRYDFHVVTTNGSAGNLQEDLNLNEPRTAGSTTPKDFKGTLGAPTRGQKTQVVLHCTAGNSSAEATVNWWNNTTSGVGGAQYVLERTTVPQAVRPEAQADADKQDTQIVDAVRVMPEDAIVYHAGVVNDCSVGIEIANVGWGFYLTNQNNEPSLSARCNPQSSCPQRIDLNAGTANPPAWRCNCLRPLDENRWIHLAAPLAGYNDYQGFEDEQYVALILLLRHLSIAHRISRKFLGTTTEEMFRHWYHGSTNAQERALWRNTVFHFRGILHHRNVHENKPCPGVLHRNRLFRGIIDEWWLPFQEGEQTRSYYSGPFRNPAYVAGQATQPAYFLWGTGARPTVTATTYRNANIDALAETKSYYNLNNVDNYYSLCETNNGGLFPVGKSRVWHGGIHFFPSQTNPTVYAAASGTIVAARIASNAETQSAEKFGSQGFVLLRHYVHPFTQQDPGGLGERIDYSRSVRVFTLYMHLGDLVDINAEHNQNPPWFNLWRRNNPNTAAGLTTDGERGIVFNPDIEVMVGDVLGIAGTYAGITCFHFELFSHRNDELSIQPWEAGQPRSSEPDDQNAVYDSDSLEQFLQDELHDGVDSVDVLKAARRLRRAKTLNKSEWSMQSADALSSVIPNAQTRNDMWRHISRLIWWNDAIAANAQLRDQLGQDGIVWHYHPITFMHCINTLVNQENHEIQESQNQTHINVEIDSDFFISRFVAYQGGAWVGQNADNANIVPYQISDNAYTIPFQRRHIACQQCLATGATPQTTHLSFALLEALQEIRMHFGQGIQLQQSYLCPTHNAPALCNLNTDEGVAQHAEGLAIDFRPSAISNASCTSIVRSLRHIVEDLFNPTAVERGGMVCQDTMPPGYRGLQYQILPASASAKLLATPPQALTADERNDFSIHLNLSRTPTAVNPADPNALPVRLKVSMQKLYVIDDSDTFSQGEWSLEARINNQRVGLFNESVTDGQVIDLGARNWTREVSLNAANHESLSIKVINATEEDTFSNDDLGTIDASYNQSSTPAWGIGTQTLTSTLGNYRVQFTVESLNDDVDNI